MDAEETRKFVMSTAERHKALYERLLSDRAIKAMLKKQPAEDADTSPAAPHGTPGSAV